MHLPENVVNLIMAYAHPIHPCKWEIDFFRHMAYWVLGEDDHEWTGCEFHDWVKWREALDRNGHSCANHKEANSIFLFY